MISEPGASAGFLIFEKKIKKFVTFFLHTRLTINEAAEYNQCLRYFEKKIEIFVTFFLHVRLTINDYS